MQHIVFIIDDSTLFLVNIIYKSERSWPEGNKMPKSKEISIRLEIGLFFFSFFLFQVPTDTYLAVSELAVTKETRKSWVSYA